MTMGDDEPARRSSDPWLVQRAVLGQLIRSQRQLANLSLRELGQLTGVSNAYLSQIERGMHTPTVRVLRAIAGALDISADALLDSADTETAQRPGDPLPVSTEASIRADPRLTDEQKRALLVVYRSYVEGTDERG